MNHLLNNIQGYAQNGYAGNHLMMAFGDNQASTDVSATYGASAGASAFVPELWAAGVAGYFEKPTTFASLADSSLSGLVQASGDTIHIPKMAAHSATATTPQAISALSDATIAYHSNDDGETKLTINKLAYSAHIISDVVKIQASPELMTMYTQGMGYAIKQDVENYLGDLFSGGTIGNMIESTLGTDNEFDLDDAKTLLQLMYTNGVHPSDGFVMVVSPELATHMVGIANFTSSDYASIAQISPRLGQGGDIHASGQLFGMPVYVSDRFTNTGTTNTIVGAVFKPDNLKVAYQVSPTVVSEYSVDHLGTKIAAYVAYGASIVDQGQVFGITQA